MWTHARDVLFFCALAPRLFFCHQVSTIPRLIRRTDVQGVNGGKLARGSGEYEQSLWRPIHSITVLAPMNTLDFKADRTENALAGRAFFNLALDPWLIYPLEHSTPARGGGIIDVGAFWDQPWVGGYRHSLTRLAPSGGWRLVMESPLLFIPLLSLSSPPLLFFLPCPSDRARFGANSQATI